MATLPEGTLLLKIYVLSLSLPIILGFLLTACTTFKPPKPSLPKLTALDPSALVSFRTKLEARIDQLEQFRALLRIRSRTTGDTEIFRLIFVQDRKTGKLRLEILPPGVGRALLVMVIDGNRFSALSPAEKTFYTGRVALLPRLLDVPLPISSLAMVITATVDPRHLDNWNFNKDSTNTIYALSPQTRSYFRFQENGVLLEAFIYSVFNDSFEYRYLAQKSCDDTDPELVCAWNVILANGQELDSALVFHRVHTEIAESIFTLTRPASFQTIELNPHS